jgi:hypothetical protein
MLRPSFLSSHCVSRMSFGQMAGPDLCYPNIVPDKMSVGQLFFAQKTLNRTSINQTLHYPNVCQPNVCQPNVCQPNVCQPNVCQPNVCQPNVCQPNVCQPKWQGRAMSAKLSIGRNVFDQKSYNPLLCISVKKYETRVKKEFLEMPKKNLETIICKFLRGTKTFTQTFNDTLTMG